MSNDINYSNNMQNKYWVKVRNFCVLTASFLKLKPLARNEIPLSKECVERLQDQSKFSDSLEGLP